MKTSMVRLTFAGFGTALLLASGSTVFSGCGGAANDDLFGEAPGSQGNANGDAATTDDPPGVTPGTDAAGTDPDGTDPDLDGGSSLGDATTPSDDADTTHDAAPEEPVDSGTDAGPPASDLSPSPGEIPCGNKKCGAKAQVCCVGAIPEKCGAASSNDDDEGKCKAKACDESADCGDGQVCCYDNLNVPASYCAASCKAGDVKACQSDAECTGSKCETYTCSVGLIPLGKINACSKGALCYR